MTDIIEKKEILTIKYVESTNEELLYGDNNLNNYLDEMIDFYHNLVDEYNVFGFLNNAKFTDFYEIINNNSVIIENTNQENNDDYNSDYSVDE
jgi:hypothetical protein